MFDSAINYMDKFGPEILVIQFGFLVILSTIFLWLWFSNRRKYHNLKHAIPANVVKSYLDSIIQNSTALKSQLFRGGGQDVGGVPSVMSLQNLIGGDGLAVSGAPSTALLEELNQKKAHIAALEAQLSSSKGSQPELESKLNSTLANLSNSEKKIKELESLLTQNRSGDSGGDAGLKSELNMVSKERNELRDRLKEFEIIADDLANLKRLQQENEQLKRSLAAQGQSAPAAAAVEDVQMNQAEVSDLFEELGQTSPQSEDNAALEEFLSSPTDTSDADEAPVEPISEEDPMLAAVEAPTPEVTEKPKSEKTPEDLLSEFEKMLG